MSTGNSSKRSGRTCQTYPLDCYSTSLPPQPPHFIPMFSLLIIAIPSLSKYDQLLQACLTTPRLRPPHDTIMKAHEQPITQRTRVNRAPEILPETLPDSASSHSHSAVDSLTLSNSRTRPTTPIQLKRSAATSQRRRQVRRRMSSRPASAAAPPLPANSSTQTTLPNGLRQPSQPALGADYPRPATLLCHQIGQRRHKVVLTEHNLANMGSGAAKQARAPLLSSRSYLLCSILSSTPQSMNSRH